MKKKILLTLTEYPNLIDITANFSLHLIQQNEFMTNPFTIISLMKYWTSIPSEFSNHAIVIQVILKYIESLINNNCDQDLISISSGRINDAITIVPLLLKLNFETFCPSLLNEFSSSIDASFNPFQQLIKIV